MTQDQILQQAIVEAKRFIERGEKLLAEPYNNGRVSASVGRSSMELTHLLSNWRNFTRHQGYK
jgi:hypothetical protein